MVGRLKGVTLLGKRVPPTKSEATNKQDGPETLPLSQEETWRKRSKNNKRKSKYFNPPPTKKRAVQAKTYMPNETSSDAGEKLKGSCPHWGGEGIIGQQRVSITNTCTIDNLLYMLYLSMKRPCIKNDLKIVAHLDPWISTLLEVNQLFEQREWSQGKLLWLNKIDRFKGNSWDCFGTEEDFAASRLDYMVKTEIQQNCKNSALWQKGHATLLTSWALSCIRRK